MFGHEKFVAYQSAIKFAALAAELLESLPSGNSHLADQLRRASISIALNIAEGSGKQTENDKRRYYAIARGSAMECAAILDILSVLSLIAPEIYCQGKEHLKAIAGILSVICIKNKAEVPAKTMTMTMAGTKAEAATKAGAGKS